MKQFVVEEIDARDVRAGDEILTRKGPLVVVSASDTPAAMCIEFKTEDHIALPLPSVVYKRVM